MSSTVQPRNPRRMPWSEVPDAVVARIEAVAGSVIESVAASPFGFSPGFAGVVSFADGARAFLKVMSASRDPWSIEVNRREAHVLALLPKEVPAPVLLWIVEEGDWLVIAAEAVDGEHPRASTVDAHAHEVWVALGELARVEAPADLPAFHAHHADLFTQWRDLATSPELDARLSAFGRDGQWIGSHLPQLMEWEQAAKEITKGDALVHGDLRDDNLLLTADGVRIVDWPHASRGAPWLDLAGYLPSHEMYGGGSAHGMFRAHPLAEAVSSDAERFFVCTLAGYFTFQSTEPPVAALPGLREFQRAQALPALKWLREIADPALAR